MKKSFYVINIEKNMLDKRGWGGVKKGREALLHAISSAIPVSTANCTLAFLQSASSLNPSPEHQTSHPTAYWTSPAGCPTGASNPARIKLNQWPSLASTCPCSIPPYLKEQHRYHLPPRLLSLILLSNYSPTPFNSFWNVPPGHSFPSINTTTAS